MPGNPPGDLRSAANQFVEALEQMGNEEPARPGELDGLATTILQLKGALLTFECDHPEVTRELFRRIGGIDPFGAESKIVAFQVPREIPKG